MAVKWAVADGNWSAGATWNDGVVPTIDDYVYLDGHTITVDTSFSIGNGTISNGTNPQTSLSGGALGFSGNYIITANFDCHTGMVSASSSGSRTFVGNITTYNGASFFTHTTNNTLVINITGNISANSGIFFQRSASATASVDIFVNGNLSMNNCSLISNRYNGTKNLTINGNASINGGGITTNDTIFLDSFVLNGNLSNIYGRTVKATTLTITGNIEYASNTGGMGVFANTLNIGNSATFTWKDVTEPRTNPFIILTDAEMNNHQQYPPENEVKEGTEYVWGEKVGTYQQPPESVVLDGYIYDNGEKVGTLENQNVVGCVTKEDVREGVELIGLQEVGTLVVPDVDDVREGVIFDNGSVGTLIVQGGGDRLRIANFGYYTDSQSDTYIVDINESFKPMFATAEESVLLELFPELDLDNIPDKYFDDLFVKYLKYRLIVEYYRGAGINSVFTPSELTTEVVNYQNVRCEYWLNLANIYLNAWDKKYPNSVKKQRILL